MKGWHVLQWNGVKRSCFRQGGAPREFWTREWHNQIYTLMYDILYYDHSQKTEEKGQESDTCKRGACQESNAVFPACILFVNMANFDKSFLAYDITYKVIQQTLVKLTSSTYGKARVG